TISSLAVGSHSISAAYGGDANFTAGTSAALAEAVGQAATGVTLTSSATTTVAGQPVTFTAVISVTAPGAGTPTGTVTFRDGATTRGTGSVNAAGQATFTISSLAVAGHPITAVYGGDANFTASTSAPLTETVNQGATATAVAASANPAAFGQA